MRWKFLIPPISAEVETRNNAELLIDRWWAEFAARCQAITDHFTRSHEFDVPEFMARHLQAIHPALMWEFGRGLINGGHRLVITPEVERGLRPMVRHLIERAPVLDRWEFYEYRLQEPDDVIGMVHSRIGTKLDALKGRASVGKGNLIDVWFDGLVGDEQQQRNCAFVAAETLFGERTLDEWIGRIETQDGSEAKSLDLHQLSAEVSRLREQIRSDQLNAPCYEVSSSCQWTMWQLKPKKASDYPGQLDLFVAKSMLPELWNSAHSGIAINSSRFSRHGETFCYLKLDGSEELDREMFADKSEIEDAIDDALIPARLGCHIGGGTGLKYSYVDLALTNVGHSIDVLRSRLREGNVPRKSWILFFDDNYRDEWIGIWDDTPPPPKDSE